MPIVDNKKSIQEIQSALQAVKNEIKNPLIQEPFMKDFALRFCWSSNAIEGNTLSLEETISVIEYDEVRSGHTYTEYQDAKNLYRAIQKFLIPFCPKKITEEWIKSVNGLVRNTTEEYRREAVYIGTIVEAVYYPPAAEEVPELMEKFVGMLQDQEETFEKKIESIAERHIQFERIHPFKDGNGRTGRIILNQQLINAGFLPITIEPKGKYRQAFRQYEKNRDISLMVYVLCKSEQESIQRVQRLIQRKNQQYSRQKTEQPAPRI